MTSNRSRFRPFIGAAPSTRNLAVYIILALMVPLFLPASAQIIAPGETSDLKITEANVRVIDDLQVVVFELTVEGEAGRTVPEAAGQLDGAPVLGYVFPTTLAPGDVGFAPGEGIVALAATSHPDFDDTPLWDESSSGSYDDDGRVFHTHWVVLVPDDRVAGGLSVKESRNAAEDLPPTAPGMPIYLDSPGFNVVLRGNTLRLVVPLFRLSNNTDFRFDAVTAYMQVNTSKPDVPMLGVYKVYDVLSNDLSLPFTVN